MKKSLIEGEQNAEVSVKIPCEKSFVEQLEIMELYTETHRRYDSLCKEKREVECLKVLYPRMFRKIEEKDLIVGRLDFLPIGFGCVTSLGGVGHYCVFHKLREFERNIGKEYENRVEKLFEYWEDHDVKALFCRHVLTETTIGRFIDCDYPLMATARLSGMMLHYDWLCERGIGGIIEHIRDKIKADPGNDFLQSSLDAMYLLQTVIDDQQRKLKDACAGASDSRQRELDLMLKDLKHIRSSKPETFHQAIQLIWLYALVAGCINYGRLDDILGPYLVNDLRKGLITEDEAYAYLKSLWTLIENRRTTVNGRIIVGGYGRKNPKEADEFARLAIKVTKDCKYVEPQFTLRFNKETPEDIWNMAMDSLGEGATYPTLYNDDVNVPAVMYGMRIDKEAAEQYVPLGCTEFVIQGQSVGTPNILFNLLKLLTITLNKEIDPFDGKYKAGPVRIKDLSEMATFDDLYSNYKELLDYYMDLSIKGQCYSYECMNQEVSFLFTSILMDDCIERGKSLLDGGVRYLGGTNETYGNINTSDSLYAIKKLVYEDHTYTLEEIHEAVMHNFEGYERLRKHLLECDKYGNDLQEVDDLANDLYEYVAKGVRQRGIDAGLQYFLIVISNNQVNTEWGRCTAASPDGRLSGMFMNPANNPQSGAAKSGPTACLNSLRKFDPRYHGGSVQSMKFTPNVFNNDRKKTNMLLKTYFKHGGCHLMITVVDKGVLEDAQKHPEKYPNLIVRVSGFSAVFVDLEKDVQDEVMARVLYD